MLNEEQIKKLIAEAQNYMEETKRIFGKEIYQKRVKQAIEGFLSALCTVLEEGDGEKTLAIRGIKDHEDNGMKDEME